MLTLFQIRKQVQQYLDGLISLDEFEDWLVSSSWDMHQSADKDAQHLVGAIELRLAEYAQGHLDDKDLKYELQMILVYGSKLPIANMLVFTSERGVTANSSSSPDQLPINTVVIAGNYVPSTETRPATWSAAGRTITGREILQLNT